MTLCCPVAEDGQAGAPLVALSSRDLAKDFLFPMCIVTVKDVLELSVPLHHQELDAQGKLAHWEPGMFATLVSHQWLGYRHPDPGGDQFRELQQTLRAMTKDLAVESSIMTQLVFQKYEKLTEETRRQLAEGYIWFDWFSIPQLAPTLQAQSQVQGSKSSDHRTSDTEGEQAEIKAQMIAAVKSIPAYVAACKLFLVNCPACRHHNTGAVCDLHSWQRRGWCRAELACRILSTREATSVIVAQGSSFVEYMNPTDWLFAMPGSGEFTCAEDKDLLLPVLTAALDWKVSVHEAYSSDQFEARFFRAMRGHLLSGLEAEEEEPGSTVESFLAKYKFQSVEDSGAKGLRPLAVAAIEGNAAVVKQLLELRCDVEAATSEGAPEFFLDSGMRPLHLGSYLGGSTAVVRLLLHHRADPDAATAKTSFTALSYATFSGRSAVFDQLIEGGADSDRRDAFGVAYMHIAGMFGQLEILENLLRRGADLNARNMWGMTPLQLIGYYHNDTSVAQMLLAHHADVNAQVEPVTFAGGGMCNFGQFAVALGSQRLVLRVFGELRGSTALHAAVMCGRVELSQLLLDSQADCSLRNCRGNTPLDLEPVRKPGPPIAGLKLRVSV